MEQFNARVVYQARKPHKCLTCGRTIEKGQGYISYPGHKTDGSFGSISLCYECGYLMTQKTGARYNSITAGEFSDIKIPNFLRKKRAEFRANPRKAIMDAKLNETPQPKPRPINRIVVKRSEFCRSIFHVNESPAHTVEHFPCGSQVVIQVGVTGESRVAVVKKSCSTKGDAFGCSRRQIALLLIA